MYTCGRTCTQLNYMYIILHIVVVKEVIIKNGLVSLFYTVVIVEVSYMFNSLILKLWHFRIIKNYSYLRTISTIMGNFAASRHGRMYRVVFENKNLLKFI